ncbi:hypothetical protein MHYP_G00264170 [Metynnis hypsauchen]
MEIQCLEHLFTLAHLNGKKSHSESSEVLLRLVETNQWTPVEAVTLLKALSEKYAEEALITKVLTLVQVNDASPGWTDDSGHSLIQALDSVGPERFPQDFQRTLRKQDGSEESRSSFSRQLTTRCNMLGYFDQNISEAVKKLEEIKERGRDAIVNESPTFSLVSSADEELQAESYNLYSQGLGYVFSVEEEPRFPWEALLVFCLRVLQIIGGALLTAFTCGTLAQVGMGLITEGISDCIFSIESMVTGEFSWKSWDIEKAISISVSLIGFGVGKLISKGFKASKLAIKGFDKELKSMPKFLSRQAKDGLRVAATTNMNNAVKHTVKTIVKETIIYGFSKAEEAILREIINSIKNEVKKETVNNVKHNPDKEPLATSVDSIILSYLEDKQQLSDLLQDKNRKSKLLAIFREFSNTALQPFYADLSWQNKLNSSIYKVIERAKSEVKGTSHVILTAFQATHWRPELKRGGESGKRSQSHAEKIRNPTTAGTILDIRVLSETTGTMVVILTEDSHGKLTKMQELNPSTKPARQTVTLIYIPKSAQYPDGHHDVLINYQRV